MANDFCVFLPKLKPIAETKDVPQFSNSFFDPKKVSNHTFQKETKRGTYLNPKLYYGEHSILFIHEKIQEKLLHRIKSLQDLEKERKVLATIVELSTEPIDRVLAVHKLTRTREIIKGLENGLELLLYKSSTEKLISRYKQLCTSEIKSFTESSLSSVAIQEEKDNLIFSFVCIAQEYINIAGFFQKRKKVECEKCRIEMECTENAYICPVCGKEVEILDDTPSFKDISRVNTTSRYIYVRDGHFIKAWREFQGIHPVTKAALKNGERCLLEEMQKHHLTEKTVTKDHLYTFLTEQGLGDNYENIHLLYSMITGIPCADFSEYYHETMYLFYQQERAYELVKDVSRDNSLIVNYKLLKVIQRLCYVHNLPHNYKKHDFFCLKTDNKRCEHDDVMEKAWNVLQWPWISST